MESSGAPGPAGETHPQTLPICCRAQDTGAANPLGVWRSGSASCAVPPELGSEGRGKMLSEEGAG